ncbi:MAG: hypothetical protein NUV97_00745 [archaeon]|nr:hypothetical protein [archaeon]MCR4323357.1 hypothetical protein [Nanoarchaeota archaeon]
MELPSPEKESEYKASVDDEGHVVLKKKVKIKSGKKAKASGGQFELKVRKDLEEKGWIVDKWSNNVDLDEKRIVPAKRKFNPFAKIMTIGTGFPDFIAFQLIDGERYKIIGVEVKINGLLGKEEKQKCSILLENKTFNEILVAKKVKEKNRVRVEYTDFKDIEKRMR